MSLQALHDLFVAQAMASAAFTLIDSLTTRLVANQ